MAFTLPTFNIYMNWWAPGLTPENDDPTFEGQIVQVYYSARRSFDSEDGATLDALPSLTIIRVPRDFYFISLIDTPYVGGIWKFQDDQGSHRWCYKVVQWDLQHVGFSNEYFEFVCAQCDNEGVIPDSRR